MAKKKKVKKRPSSIDLAAQGKQPRTSDSASESVNGNFRHSPVWQIQKIDFLHDKWGWSKISRKHFADMVKKLSDYETRTWGEIINDQKRDHAIPIDQLHPEAQKRLKVLKMDDIDEIFRLRLDGKKRIFGVLDGFIFKILWWDPDHTVCLSPKKHT